MNRLKKLALLSAAAVTGGIGAVTAGSAVNSAEAYTYNPWTVQTNTATGIRAYDHIDQYGNPYGASEVRWGGQTFTRTVDWDMVTWSGKYYCLRYKLNTSAWRTDCSPVGHHKISTDQRALLYTVRR